MGYVRPETTEMCAECMSEVTLLWNPDKEGYTAYCPYCGNLLMLCDACKHADDNPKSKCINDKCTGLCYRRLQDIYHKARKEFLK